MLILLELRAEYLRRAKLYHRRGHHKAARYNANRVILLNSIISRLKGDELVNALKEELLR